MFTNEEVGSEDLRTEESIIVAEDHQIKQSESSLAAGSQELMRVTLINDLDLDVVRLLWLMRLFSTEWRTRSMPMEWQSVIFPQKRGPEIVFQLLRGTYYLTFLGTFTSEC